MAYARRNTSADGTWNRAWTADTTADLASILALSGHPGGPQRGDHAFVTATSAWYLWTDDNKWQGISVVTVDLSTTGSIDDYDCGSDAPFVRVRCTNATKTTITGMVARAGQTLEFISTAAEVDFAHQGGSVPSSTATNRAINFVTSGVTPMLKGSARFFYDTTTTRWRMEAHEQGNWIAVPFSAGNFTGGAGTWTVGSGDVVTYETYLKGTSLFVTWYINTTTVGGVTSQLLITLPNGYTIAATSLQAFVYNDAGTGLLAGFCQVSASGTTILLEKLTAAAWTAVSDGTGVYGTVVANLT